jgi:carbonic anhydrase
MIDAKGMELLFHRNRQWAEDMVARDPAFFSRLLHQQSPRWLWIGCSDSRVPANQIVGLDPGEVFVHRNVGNLVHPGDLNCMSVLQYAVEVLQVEHVIVCGHYGCGGVKAAMEDSAHGLIDYWIWSIREIRDRHQTDLDHVPQERRVDALCEMNVIEQVERLSETKILKEAWSRRQDLQVHGIIYSLADGLIRDLEVSAGARGDAAPAMRLAREATLARHAGQ